MNFLDELRNLDINDPGRWPLPCASRSGCSSSSFSAVRRTTSGDHKEHARGWSAPRPRSATCARSFEQRSARPPISTPTRAAGRDRALVRHHAAPAAGPHRGARTCWSTSPRPAWPPACRRSCSSRWTRCAASSTPRSRSGCGSAAPTTSWATSSAALPRCRAS
jgi:hypothetical protein